MMAFDLDNQLVWLGKNGTWEGGGNPGVSSASWTGVASDAKPSANETSVGSIFDVWTTPDDFTYSVPAGFLGWAE
jgi:hypothetical protein